MLNKINKKENYIKQIINRETKYIFAVQNQIVLFFYVELYNQIGIGMSGFLWYRQYTIKILIFI